MRGLQDKVIVVAGAASGIGEASVRRLAEEGAKVVVGDINIAAAQAVAEEIRSVGGDALAAEYDQGDWGACSGLVAKSLETYGHIDGMFPNAINDRLVARDTDLLDVKFEVWDAMLQVGMTGYFYLIRAALPHLLETKGVILCSSSDASTIGEINRPSFGVTKGGINALVRHVATRWGPEGIRANAICPFALNAKHLASVGEETVNHWLEVGRAGRIAGYDEIGSAVAFLFSDDASWINGQIIGVNGGMNFRL